MLELKLKLKAREGDDRGREAEIAQIEHYLGGQMVFSVPEVAKLLGRTTWWVRGEVSTGRLRAVRLGERDVISRAVLVELLMGV